MMPPSLTELERCVAIGDRNGALSEAIRILDHVEGSGGRIDGVEFQGGSEKPSREAARAFAARFTTALTQLFIQPGFQLAAREYDYLLQFHRWIDVLFHAAGNTLYEELPSLLGATDTAEGLSVPGGSLKLALVLFPLEILSRMNEDELIAGSANVFALLNHINSRTIFTEGAYALRERMLEILPKILDKTKVELARNERMLESYMLCSYATTSRKHDIKAKILQQVRRSLRESGIADSAPRAPHAAGTGKPVVIVACEHISHNHSVYRSHSPAIRSLREHFHVVGLVMRSQIHPALDQLFDEIVPLDLVTLPHIVPAAIREIRLRKPAAIFYPSIGMSSHVVALAAFRLAPVQCTSWGHGASSFSPVIDHMIIPEDLVGSPDCYSEKIVRLPAAAMPFARAAVSSGFSRKPPDSERDGVVRVAVSSAIMKLNSRFFAALGQIAGQARTRLEFQIFPAMSEGVVSAALANVLTARLPSVTVFDAAPFDIYMERLSRCDMFLCPFPYGNANSIVDCAMAGLPGVCLDGPQPHEHYDAALFARAGLPPSLVATTVEEYVSAAVRLIDYTDWRNHCRQVVADCDLDAAYFAGDPRLFSQAFLALLKSK